MDAVAIQKELTRKIAALTAKEGENATPIPGLALYRRSAPSPCYRATYDPSFTVFAQGRKRINLGGTEYLCAGG